MIRTARIRIAITPGEERRRIRQLRDLGNEVHSLARVAREVFERGDAFEHLVLIHRLRDACRLRAIEDLARTDALT